MRQLQQATDRAASAAWFLLAVGCCWVLAVGANDTATKRATQPVYGGILAAARRRKLLQGGVASWPRSERGCTLCASAKKLFKGGPISLAAPWHGVTAVASRYVAYPHDTMAADTVVLGGGRIVEVWVQAL
jgi:hypothetical protein